MGALDQERKYFPVSDAFEMLLENQDQLPDGKSLHREITRIKLFHPSWKCQNDLLHKLTGYETKYNSNRLSDLANLSEEISGGAPTTQHEGTSPKMHQR